MPCQVPTADPYAKTTTQADVNANEEDEEESEEYLPMLSLQAAASQVPAGPARFPPMLCSLHMSGRLRSASAMLRPRSCHRAQGRKSMIGGAQAGEKLRDTLEDVLDSDDEIGAR